MNGLDVLNSYNTDVKQLGKTFTVGIICLMSLEIILFLRITECRPKQVILIVKDFISFWAISASDP